MTIATTDPATGKTIKTFSPDSDAAIDEKLAKAAAVAAQWRKVAFAERSQRMSRAAALLEQRKDALGRLMTLEMGKLKKAAAAEIEKCAAGCRYYAENAERHLAPEPVQTDAKRSEKRFQPLGPVLAIMPWNCPFWQVFRFAAPALMAGNVGLLKHASSVPQCALAIEQIFREAGFPKNLFQTLLIGSDMIEGIIADARIAAVTLTGSEGAGRSVASAAGRNLKKSVLELGGSDPFVVMPSADLDNAVSTAVTARMINNGQSCIAAKRFIVHEKIYDEFLRKFIARVATVRVGDPMDEKTELGPLATAAIRDQLDQQVKGSVAAGAKLVTGGKKIHREGFFYEPTILADIPPTAPAASEELFGPVASVFKAKDLGDAIRIANGTTFGLGASAWTRDDREQAQSVAEIESGLLFINGMVVSDPRLPFGGVKNSGFGRELGEFGIHEFVNIKSVRVLESQKAEKSVIE